ncbi:MAG: hypothetical protein LQ345_006316 [Seirophora villosa]|nr:MAG: hypothetical protein LQ345_006316 [Seirophora villosa]
MVFNTITVGSAVTPVVIETYFSHYLNRKPLRQKPTAHISYHEGLHLIRRFLHHASYHTVEDIQAFTSQWVPSPHWVKAEEVSIPQKAIDDAAEAIIAQLGHKGVDKVGGSKWWQWRRDGTSLRAEWIEMRADYERRKRTKEPCKRVILYVHGGAYYFGSVDEHRYQIQRHARKLGARVLARVAGDAPLDYIPPHGFLHRPSAAWPPPNTDDMEQIAMHAVEKVVGEGMPRKSSQHERQVAREEAVQGFSVDHKPRNLHPEANGDNPAGSEGAGVRPGNTIPGPGHDLSIMLDENLVSIKDQIQMYTTNQLISHPLVSPALQPSLGGLPPLLILTGGGEMLRDEQIYIAHKAANPAKYPPGEAYMNEYPDAAAIVDKWKPTDVQLQVWDDLCHVAPTLSFTRPAKYMYRSIAQFGAWALAKAQKTDIEIMDDDDVSVISSGSDTDDSSDVKKPQQENSMVKDGVAQGQAVATDKVGKAGEPLPAFKNHMIRQRVDRHGNIFPLGPASSLPALQMSANEVGVIKPEPVRRWLGAKKEWDTKFAREKRRVQKRRVEEMAKGFQGFGDDEVPPPSALAGRRGLNMAKEAKTKKSWGMSLWSLWGNSHDEKTLKREEEADKEAETTTATPSGTSNGKRTPQPRSRSRSRRRIVSYTGQSGPDIDESTPALEILRRRQEGTDVSSPNDPFIRSPTSISHAPPSSPSTTASPLPSPPLSSVDATTSHLDAIAGTASQARPATQGKAFPFKLGTHLRPEGQNASTTTLTSQMNVGLPTPGVDGGPQLGEAVGEEQKMAGRGERPEIERFETAREGF